MIRKMTYFDRYFRRDLYDLFGIGNLLMPIKLTEPKVDGRTGGLESVGMGEVGTLRGRSGVFRLIREEDFQALLGLASEAKPL